VLKWRISGDREIFTTFLRRLVTGSWGLGAVLVVAGHLTLIATAEHRAGLGDTASVWINLLATVVFVAAMTLLLLSALGKGAASRGWIVPLVIGTCAVHVATVLWYPVIDVDKGCAGEVSSSYYSDMTNISAVVLLALRVELNFVGRSRWCGLPGHRNGRVARKPFPMSRFPQLRRTTCSCPSHQESSALRQISGVLLRSDA
jgi:hypothetical protein